MQQDSPSTNKPKSLDQSHLLGSGRSISKIHYTLETKNMKSRFPLNSIRTSKYSILSFIPLNLIHQFSKAANIYFVILTLLQLVKAISITSGVPTIAPTLTFIIALSMIKDFLEDYKRWKSDSEENNAKAEILTPIDFMDIEWKDIRVGSIIRVKENENIPADMILLETSEKKTGKCFVETKSLDGETNLKLKEVPETFRKITGEQGAKEYSSFNEINAHYEDPNPLLYTFNGSLHVNNQKIAIEEHNFLLRASKLKNTSWAVGLVCYTGHDTKIMMNSISAKEKKSQLENQMNIYILIVFLFLILFCTLGSFFYIIWLFKSADKEVYLEISMGNMVVQFFTRAGNWILIFGNFVPISLMVTVETVKFVQATLMSRDKKMEKEDSDGTRTGVVVQSSNLNEELGQVEYVFSDKTGTLTCNNMIFKKLLVGSEEYPNDEQIQSERSSMNEAKRPGFILDEVDNVDFEDNSFFAKITKDEQVDEILLFLSLCHSILVHGGRYNASSPDELALVNFAKKCGYEFIGKNENNEMTIRKTGKEATFTLKYILEFNSNRKRMSVIIKDQNNKYWLYCKGADSVILKRSKPTLKVGSIDLLKSRLDALATKGLRTLLLAKKEISEKEFKNFHEVYESAKNDVIKRDVLVAQAQEKIEQDLTIIGATAIEDKLQDKVPETIYDLRQAGIKIWMLTGDKVETAITIGFSCNLINSDMNLFKIVETCPDTLNDLLDNYIQKAEDSDGSELKNAVIVSGDAIITLSDHPLLSKKFAILTLKCESVLCCRVSPKQKQDIVAMVRTALPDKRTLAIGDGANDVNMIVRAHVGIGIRGVEGKQASRAADFAIGEFKVLKKLLFVYGRESYRKNSIMVLYSFWKNIVLVVPQFFYALLFNNFSGVTLYEAVLYQLVNVFYTSMPIMIFAIFDKELPTEALLNRPYYYKNGLKRIHFNFSNFMMWFFTGVTQAFLIAIFCAFADFEPQRGGEFLGFWGYGIFVFLCTQLIANLKIFIITNSYNFWIYFFTVGSFLLFIISFVVIDTIKSNTHYRLLYRLVSSPIFHTTLILVIISCFYFDYLWNLIQRMIFFKYLNIKVNQAEKVKEKDETVKSSDSIIVDYQNTERNNMITKDFTNKENGSTLNKLNSGSFITPKNNTINYLKNNDSPKDAIKSTSDIKEVTKITENRVKTALVKTNLDKEYFPL